jgi:hypothetical protein
VEARPWTQTKATRSCRTTASSLRHLAIAIIKRRTGTQQPKVGVIVNSTLCF